MRWPDLTIPLACGAAVGAGALAAAQFVGIFMLTPSGPDQGIREEVVVGAQEQHGWAMLILAVIALVLLISCIWFDRGEDEDAGPASQTTAVALAVTGLVALLIFLIIDVPDANRIGALGNETGSFVDAKALPQIGFWLELFGSLLLAGCGAVLAYSSLTGTLSDTTVSEPDLDPEPDA